MAKNNLRNDQAWEEARREVTERLSLRAEFDELGFREISDADSDGWASAKSADGRPDANPSVSLNLLTGVSIDRGGGEFDFVSLFKRRVILGKAADYRESIRYYADKAGVKLPAGKMKHPEDKLSFRAWNDALAMSWCDHKKGISPQVIKLAGGRLAHWPTTKKYSVFAFPVFGPRLLADDPIGYTLYNITGGTLPYKGTWKKMLLAGESQKGWIGLQGLQRLATADIIWKVEGTTDLLAVMSAMAAAGVTDQSVISNSHGSTEPPQDDLCAVLAGKRVFVLHDADKSGETGAVRWAKCIAQFAREVRHVRLPFAIKDSHGLDVRDFINGVVEGQEVAA